MEVCESHAMRQSTKRGYYRKNAAGGKHNVKIITEEIIVENTVGDHNTVIKTKVEDHNTVIKNMEGDQTTVHKKN